MRRAPLEHLLRAASVITGEREILVMGSRSVLATRSENEPPAEATAALPGTARLRHRRLLAGREKDLAFAGALVRARLIDPAVLAVRIETLDAHPAAVDRARSWIRNLSH